MYVAYTKVYFYVALQASYCSEACRDTAWRQYHKTLCTRSFTRDASHPLVILQETWK